MSKPTDDASELEAEFLTAEYKAALFEACQPVLGRYTSGFVDKTMRSLRQAHRQNMTYARSNDLLAEVIVDNKSRWVMAPNLSYYKTLASDVFSKMCDGGDLFIPLLSGKPPQDMKLPQFLGSAQKEKMENKATLRRIFHKYAGHLTSGITVAGIAATGAALTFTAAAYWMPLWPNAVDAGLHILMGSGLAAIGGAAAWGINRWARERLTTGPQQAVDHDNKLQYACIDDLAVFLRQPKSFSPQTSNTRKYLYG